MVLIAWLHNTSKALPVPLHVYSIIMALLAMPYGHMALWFQVTLHQGGPDNITCVQYLLIKQFSAIHFANHLVFPVV